VGSGGRTSSGKRSAAAIGIQSFARDASGEWGVVAVGVVEELIGLGDGEDDVTLGLPVGTVLHGQRQVRHAARAVGFAERHDDARAIGGDGGQADRRRP
jgi:hypothetical protein